MESALESTLSSLEARAEKLHKWSSLNIQVQSQEVAALEVAAAALQQQQQQLQQQRLTALPAIEEAATQQIQLLKYEREKLIKCMKTDGDRLLEDLKEFQRAKESSWPTALPATRAKEKCRDLWDCLTQVKEARKAAAEALTAKLNDALDEARKAIDEHVNARIQSEATINGMVRDLKTEAERDLIECRTKREEAEESLLQLLEQSCGRVEAAILKNSSVHNTAGL